jgi:hypothetical protein
MIGWVLAAVGAVGVGMLVWWQGFAAPPGHLYGMDTVEGEAAYCQAVSERIHEIVGIAGDARLRAHLDEQLAFWRPRSAGLAVQGRMALGRDLAAPGVNEGAHLHLAVQDCAWRAVGFYGHRFASLVASGL